MQNKYVPQPLGDIDKLPDIYVNTKERRKEKQLYVWIKCYFQWEQIRNNRAFRYEYKWEATDIKYKRSVILRNLCLPDMWFAPLHYWGPRDLCASSAAEVPVAN